MEKSITNGFAENLWALIQAGSPCICIETTEVERLDTFLSDLQAKHQLIKREWNMAYGWVDPDTQQAMSSMCSDGLAAGLALLVDETLDNNLLIIKQASLALAHDDRALARLQQLLARIQRHCAGKTAVILVAESLSVPLAIESLSTRLPLPLPQREEIRVLTIVQCKKLDLKIPDDYLTRICNACAGLTEMQIRQVLQLVSQKHELIDDAAIELILRDKERIIAGSGVLQMVQVNESIDDIGGLEDLKDWLKSRATIIHRLPEAEAFGIATPKGVLIAGMPGCGKSLTAKVAAHLFQLPLLRLDIGSLLGKYVGESEHNMRRALHMAETVSPCILWVDELEKAFVGMGSSNASEVTSRLLGYFLTWMQEKTSSVFVIATANDITALPPELLRKGRFDETFYVGFPNVLEREAILNIHLQRPACANISAPDIAKLATQCRDFAGADIQSAVNLAREIAFFDGKTLSQHHLKVGIQNTVSLRETLRDQVGKYEELFEKLKLKPATRQQGLTVAQMIKYADDPNQLRRTEAASNPDCPEDILNKLANDTDIVVREAVFNHPHCPQHVLSTFLNEFAKPSEANNETLKLFIVALRSPKAPKDLIAHLVNTKLQLDSLTNTEDQYLLAALPDLNQKGLEKIDKVLQAGERKTNWHRRLLLQTIVKELALPECIQLQLAEDNIEAVRHALAQYSQLSEAAQLKLVRSNIKSHHVLSTLAIHQKLSDVMQLELVKSKAESVRRNLANNPKLSEAVQLQLARDNAEDVRAALAQHPKLSEAVQSQLASDEAEDVRAALAQHPKLSEAVQLRLASDEAEDVRAALAQHPKPSEAVQLQLAIDEAEVVCCRLAKNSQLSESVQLRLSEHVSNKVRRNLAGNPQLVLSAQMKLLGCSEIDVLMALASNPTLEQQVMVSLKDRDLYQQVMNAQSGDKSLQIQLADNPDVDIRALLANNTELAEEVQLILAEDKSSYIRQRLARNSRLSETTQQRLAVDKDNGVRNTLASHPHLMESVQRILAKDEVKNIEKKETFFSRLFPIISECCAGVELAENKNISESVQLELAQDGSPKVKHRLAANLQLTMAAQHILAEDDGEDKSSSFLFGKSQRLIKCVLARNSRLEKSEQLKLAQDKNPAVRYSLAENSNLCEQAQLVLVDDEGVVDDVTSNSSKNSVKYALAGHSNLSDSAQERLAKDKNDDIRRHLAQHTRLAESTQALLARDVAWDIRFALAANPHINTSLLFADPL